MDKLIDTKRTYIGYDGQEYIDMCIPVIRIKDIVGNSIEEIKSGGNGRIDNFVWKNVSKNLDMIDVVMYANHIFNPFSIKEGDILNIPTENYNLYRPSDEPTLPDGTKHSSNAVGEKTKTYADEVEYLARMGLGVK